MTVTRIYVIAVITAMVIAIATATTAATFPNVAVFATLMSASPPEQVGNDTTTDATTTTTTTPPPAGQQQQAIHIIKHGSNSYTLSGGSSSVGSFDTTYRIAGERSAIRSAENLIISTITDDFRASPTIGYIRAGGTSATASTDATLPSPFASHEQITERITSELRRVISEAESNTSQGQHVEIKCDLGMTLEDMRCHYGPLPQAG
jgi:hypothetical protein